MPLGYLVAITCFTWCTLVALAPVRRPAPLAYLSLFSAVLFNELPFVAFLLLVVTIACERGPERARLGGCLGGRGGPHAWWSFLGSR